MHAQRIIVSWILWLEHDPFMHYRLEKLEVDVLPQGAVLISPADSLSCMRNLKELRISSLVSLPITLGQPLATLPSSQLPV